MILNLTQHKASPEQKEAGVVDLHPQDLPLLKEILTFDKIPSMDDLEKSALALVEIATAYNATQVMIGGFPPLMSVVEIYISITNIQPLYAFSQRVVEEDKEGNKKSVFKHIGFVKSYIYLQYLGS